MPVVNAKDPLPPREATPPEARPTSTSADREDPVEHNDPMAIEIGAGDNNEGTLCEKPAATALDYDAHGSEVKPESDDDLQPDNYNSDANSNNDNPFEAATDPLHNYESPEPNYTAANALPFPTLVKRFETIWQQKKKVANKQSKDELLNYLLPRKMLDEHLDGCSPFPLFRLIMPDIDTMRPTMGMKEKKIANTWTAAMGLSKESPSYRKLHRFMDPAYAGHTGTGDLSVCVKEVVEERFPSRGSKLTVGDINKLLDELKDITNSASNRGGGRGASAAHGWRQAGEDGNAEGTTAPTSGRSENKTKKKKSVSQRQIKWVEKLIRLNMSVSEELCCVGM